MEEEANLFASNILMPLFLLKKIRKKEFFCEMDDKDIEVMAKELMVPQIFLGIRLRQDDITEEDRLNL